MSIQIFIQVIECKLHKVLPKLFWQQSQQSVAKNKLQFWQHSLVLVISIQLLYSGEYLYNWAFGANIDLVNFAKTVLPKIVANIAKNTFYPARFYVLPIIPTTSVGSRYYWQH